MRYSLLLVFVLPLLLSACAGFEPLYQNAASPGSAATPAKIDKLLNRIKFEPTRDRSGQVLYTALYEQFKTQKDNPSPLYTLKVMGLDINRTGIGVAADGTSRLDQITITADFSLQRTGGGSQENSFRLREVSTYNVVGTDTYSTETAFQSTRDRMLYGMAEQVRLRLISDLRSNETQAEQ